MAFKSWREWAADGVEYEDWPEDVKDQYREYLDFRRQEKWERDHGMED